MVVIDTGRELAHECVSKAQAARIVGVDRSTIHRWINKGGAVEVYNSFIIYFKTEQHKLRRNGLPGDWRSGDYRRQ